MVVTSSVASEVTQIQVYLRNGPAFTLENSLYVPGLSVREPSSLEYTLSLFRTISGPDFNQHSDWIQFILKPIEKDPSGETFTSNSLRGGTAEERKITIVRSSNCRKVAILSTLYFSLAYPDSQLAWLLKRTLLHTENII